MSEIPARMNRHVSLLLFALCFNVIYNRSVERFVLWESAAENVMFQPELLQLFDRSS